MMNLHRILVITSLIVAGEIIFALPFHLARFFRPTLLDVMQLTPTQLGSVQGVYGIVAMLAYFPGGLLADRFPTHKLLATSLWMTALGGIYMSTFPSYNQTLLLFAFFGLTTIMLFWGALIKATREWGSLSQQGTAFGFLEGGRGLLAVLLASLGILIFDWSFPYGYDTATLQEKRIIFSYVIYIYSGVTFAIGVIIWIGLKHQSNHHRETSHISHNSKRFTFDNLIAVLRLPSVWLQAVVVLCAYTGYKSIDHLSLYAMDGYQYNAIEAAKLITLAAWIRPIVAVFAGIIADRTDSIKVLIISFALLSLTFFYLALTKPEPSAPWLLTFNVLITCIAVFSLRAVYFAIFSDYKLPIHLTGTAVGIVSVIGFLPDVFVLYVAGRLIDTNPGIHGHQIFFILIAFTALIGLLACYLLARTVSKIKKTHQIPN